MCARLTTLASAYRKFKCGRQVDRSKSYPTNDKSSRKGRGQITWTI